MGAGYNPVQGGGCVMLRKVRLYGQLAEFVGRKVIEADLSSAAEAVRMLIANFPELDRHMADQHYKVLVGDGALTLDDLHNPVGQEEIKIVPVIAGAGGGVGQTILGIALVTAAIVLAPAGHGRYISRFFGGNWNGFLTAGASVAIGSVGLSLALSGVAQLISISPEIPQGPDTLQDPRKSFSFRAFKTPRGVERQFQSSTAKL